MDSSNARLAFVACLCCLCILSITGVVIGAIALVQINRAQIGITSSTTTTTLGALNFARTLPPFVAANNNQKLAASLRASLLKNAALAAAVNEYEESHDEQKRDVNSVLLANSAFETQKENKPNKENKPVQREAAKAAPQAPAPKRVTSLQDRMRAKKQ